jgi:hypothetical protein
MINLIEYYEFMNNCAEYPIGLSMADDVIFGISAKPSRASDWPNHEWIMAIEISASDDIILVFGHKISYGVLADHGIRDFLCRVG